MAFFKERSMKTLLGELKNWFALKAKTVFSVNGHLPVDGAVDFDTIPFADNLTTDETQQVNATFTIRTTGGDISLSDGGAYVQRIMGNRIHTGYVAEEITPTVIPMPRTAPEAITAVLDQAVFKAYVPGAGTYSMEYNGTAWSANPALYGVTISNTPVSGDSISIEWDGTNDAVMTVAATTREAPDPIRITINRDVFVAYVPDSTTIMLTYTTAWSENPALYGITVINEPVAGDQIRVVYVKGDRGTITVANPSALVATGWNLYNPLTGYAYAPKYSEQYGYRIGGTYTSVKFAKTPAGTQTAITVTDGLFNIPEDGYIIVEDGDATTYIYTTWSDWQQGYVGDFASYTENVIDLSAIMSTYFANGLMQVGDIRDEIDINLEHAVSRIERLTYSAENLASVAGRQYETDRNYIYAVRTAEIVNSISLGSYLDVNEHGVEFFRGGDVGAYAEILYGNNLKDKLRRNVVTISPQTLTAAEQTQFRANIGAAGSAETTAAMDAVESAVQTLQSSMTYVVDGNKCANTVPAGAYFQLINSTIAGRSDGAYTASKAIPANTAIDSTYFTQTAPLAAGALNDAVSSLNSNYNQYVDSGIKCVYGNGIVFRTNTTYTVELTANKPYVMMVTNGIKYGLYVLAVFSNVVYSKKIGGDDTMTQGTATSDRKLNFTVVNDYSLTQVWGI